MCAACAEGGACGQGEGRRREKKGEEVPHACGMISPKMTMRAVGTMMENTKPSVSLPNIHVHSGSVTSVSRTLTRVFPMSSVQSSRLPRLRRGRIFLAHLFSLGSLEPSTITFRSSSVRLISPRLRPEKVPESIFRTRSTTQEYHGGGGVGSGGGARGGGDAGPTVGHPAALVMAIVASAAIVVSRLRCVAMLPSGRASK